MKKKNIFTIFVILGTRPEVIKLFPLIKELKRRSVNLKILHTNQHFSSRMDQEIAKDVGMPAYDYKINYKHKDSSSNLGSMLFQLSQYILSSKEKYKVILVQGDTNSTLAGALIANKLEIPLIHLEAGFRSHIRKQPEEVNRKIVDMMSDLNIVFDKTCIKNLKSEMLNQNMILSENSSFSAAHFMKKSLGKRGKKISKFRLMTVHRVENTDDPIRLKKLHNFAKELSKTMPLVWVLHPRSISLIKSFYINEQFECIDDFNENTICTSGKITFLLPQGYINFFKILSSSHSVYSDSGGIIDECIYLSKHYICLRDKTEQIEVLKKKRMILLGKKLSINLMVKKSLMFEMKKYPALSNQERNKKIKAMSALAKKIISWIKNN